MEYPNKNVGGRSIRADLSQRESRFAFIDYSRASKARVTAAPV